MNPRNFLLVVLTFIILNISGSNIFAGTSVEKNNPDTSILAVTSNYSYVHVFKGSHWWTLVYDDQGTLVDEFIDE